MRRSGTGGTRRTSARPWPGDSSSSPRRTGRSSASGSAAAAAPTTSSTSSTPTRGTAAGGLGPRLIDALIRQLPPDADRLYIEQFAGNERAGAFYAREGFAVERVEPSPAGDPGLAQVWRVRRLPPRGRMTGRA